MSEKLPSSAGKNREAKREQKEKRENTEKPEGGGGANPSREQVQQKLEDFYRRLDETKKQSQMAKTPGSEAVLVKTKEVEQKFQEFADTYRIEKRKAPILDERQKAEFNQGIDNFLEELATPEKTSKAETVNDLFGRLLPGKTDPTEVQKAVEKYGEGAIQKVFADLATLSALPPAVHQELFGRVPVAKGVNADSAKICALILAGNLEGSAYGYLLEDPTSEVKKVLAFVQKKSAALRKDLSDSETQEQGYIRSLATDTESFDYATLDTFTNKIGTQDTMLQVTIDRIKTVRARKEQIALQCQQVDGVAMQLDIALRSGNAAAVRATGDIEKSDRMLLVLEEQYGESLRETNPGVAKESANAIKRLSVQGKLSETEKVLFFGNPRSGEALAKALEGRTSVPSEADILDQIQSRETFRTGNFQTYEEKIGNKSLYYEGQNMEGRLRPKVFGTLYLQSGRNVDFIFTPEARKKLEQIPDGLQPVLLKKVTPFTMTSEARNTFQLQNSVEDSLLSETDIGFAKDDGTIVEQDGNTKVQLNPEQKRVAESIVRNERGFGIEPYVPRLELRTLAGKPYPYRLQNIRTQSGIFVEGVSVEEGVSELLAKTPPEGKTLVLKRIPSNIILRTPDSENAGRGIVKQYQCVLATDLIRKSDLAYANVQGDDLVISSTENQEEKRASATKLADAQDEKVQDVQRVLDRNPAIHSVKRAASTVQQTAGNLRQFLEASQKGSARASFVEFARTEAKGTLDILQNPGLQRDVGEAREVLLALKGTNGVALGGLEKSIDAQLKALDQFTSMLQSGRVVNLLQTIMDKSKFDEDSWENFATNDLPVLIGSVAAACLAAAAIAATLGTATPLVAAVAISAGTAAGGIVGAELTKEAIYGVRQNFDSDITSGKATFTGRSKAGAYAEGQKDFNKETGKFENKQLLTDVINPYAKEFAVGFATTLATMGIGSAVGGKLSQVLQKSSVIEKLADKSPIMQVVARKLVQANASREVLTSSPELKEAIQRALKEFAGEVVEELGDEAQEEILERFLNKLDLALSASDGPNGRIGLGTAAGVLLAIAKNTRIGKASITYDSLQADAIKSDAMLQGATVTDLGKGVFSVRHPVDIGGNVEFETVQFLPEKSPATKDSTGKAESLATEAIPPDSPEAFAKAGDTGALKNYLKMKDVDDARRVALAGTLLGETLSAEQANDLLAAHNKPGSIDNLTNAEKTAKGKALLKNKTFNREQAQLLLDSGLAGTRTLTVEEAQAETASVPLSLLESARGQFTQDRQVQDFFDKAITAGKETPALADKIREETIESGTTFIREGEKSGDAFICVSGKLEVLDKNGSILATLTGPCLVGELSSAIRVRSASVRAVGPEAARMIRVPLNLTATAINRSESVQKGVVKERLGKISGRIRGIDPKSIDETLKLDTAEKGLLNSTESRAAEALKKYLEKNPEAQSKLAIQETAPNGTVFLEGEKGAGFYLVLSGEVGLYRYDLENGVPTHLATEGPATILGEIAAINGGEINRTATAIARTQSKILFVPSDVAQEMLADPDTRRAIVELADSRLNGKRVRNLEATDLTLTPEEVQIFTDSLRSAGNDGESINKLVADFSSSEPVSPERAGELVHATENHIVFFNERGQVESHSFSGPVEWAAFLSLLKIDGKHVAPGAAELLQQVLQKTNITTNIGLLESVAVGEKPARGTKELLTERRALQEEILAESIDSVRKLSDSIQENLPAGMEGPTLIILKGNSASGKTSSIRSGGQGLSWITDAIKSNKEARAKTKEGSLTAGRERIGDWQFDGIINPDALKRPLRSKYTANATGQPRLTHNQVFSEGGMLGAVLTDTVIKQGLNGIVDKRFCTLAEVTAVVDLAVQSGYKSVVLVDIDAEAETSINRIYGPGGRTADGDDPLVPVPDIVDGFKLTRRDRKEVIDYLQNIQKEKGISVRYSLITNNGSAAVPAKPDVVAEISANGLEIRNQERYDALTTPLKEGEDVQIIKKVSQEKTTSPASQ